MPCYSILQKTKLKNTTAIVEAAKEMGLVVNYFSDLLIKIATQDGGIALSRDDKKDFYQTNYKGNYLDMLTRQYSAQKIKHWASANNYKVKETTQEV